MTLFPKETIEFQSRHSPEVFANLLKEYVAKYEVIKFFQSTNQKKLFEGKVSPSKFILSEFQGIGMDRNLMPEATGVIRRTQTGSSIRVVIEMNMFGYFTLPLAVILLIGLIVFHFIMGNSPFDGRLAFIVLSGSSVILFLLFLFRRHVQSTKKNLLFLFSKFEKQESPR